MKTLSPRGAFITWPSYPEIIVLLKMLPLGSPTEICPVATISPKGQGKQNRPPRTVGMALAAALITQQHLGPCSDKLWGQILQQRVISTVLLVFQLVCSMVGSPDRLASHLCTWAESSVFPGEECNCHSLSNCCLDSWRRKPSVWT